MKDEQQQASAGEVPKLLTEADVDTIVNGLGLAPVKRGLLVDFLRKRGVLEPEPVDPLEQAVKEASDVCAFKPNYAACMAAELRARGVTVAKRD